MFKINLGCGRDIREGYINCDYHKSFGADRVINLNKFPYPFESNSADEIYLSNVLEHLDKPTKVMNECHRILKKKGKFIVVVPYDNPYGDIHKQHFLLEFFYFFAEQGIPSKYAKERMIESKGDWQQKKHYKRFSSMKLKLIFPKGFYFYNYLIEPFVNLIIISTPAHYQQSFLKALFPANEIRIVYLK